MPNPQSGTILGAYRVEGTIGSGSMGEVFRGIDTGLNRRVAIKLLSEKHRDSPELRQRFVREGRAVAAISHPNVVQVFATGSFDDRPYIAMELLDGADLGSIVDKHGPLDSLSAAHAVLDAAQGLAAAARAGLIHRDVKPSNLVRLSDGRVKVTDFGLAKPVDPGSEPALTAMGVVVGTPDYIAPEQARGEPIDERVDIYALGGTMYFLLTGVPPFRTGKPAEDKYLKVVARHLRNPAPDAMQVTPACDRELAGLTRTMMSKKPAERPSYDELIDQLSRIVTRLDPAAVPMLLASRDRSRPIPLPGGPERRGDGPRAATDAADAR
ncbi:MAG TPA: serine/threonine-protein kinase, partial [Kofleriaceae bacterium]|nr:serine/threonine-protein kinase [Kofleriaceae bacterium]